MKREGKRKKGREKKVKVLPPATSAEKSNRRGEQGEGRARRGKTRAGSRMNGAGADFGEQSRRRKGCARTVGHSSHRATTRASKVSPFDSDDSEAGSLQAGHVPTSRRQQTASDQAHNSANTGQAAGGSQVAWSHSQTMPENSDPNPGHCNESRGGLSLAMLADAAQRASQASPINKSSNGAQNEPSSPGVQW